MKKEKSNVLAAGLVKVSNKMLSATANSRCVLVFHQPKQPEAVKKFRKF